MYLYHGSNKIIDNPKYDGSRARTDFGRGFYLTPNENQARRWSIKGKRKVVNCYRINKESLKIYKFELNLEWLLFIIYNRKVGGFDFGLLKERFKYLEDFDIIVGPTADDRMYNTLEEFFDGDISLEKTLDILNCMELSDQYLIRTENGIRNLEFLNSYELEGELLTNIINEDKVFMNSIKSRVRLYQRKAYENERYIEDIQEVINSGTK